MAIDLEQVVTYPTNADDWLKTLLIGGALTLFSFLIVPAFPVYGYVLRVLRGGIDGTEEPPVFDDWGTLLKEGVVALVIVLVYQLIPLLVFFLTVGGSLAAFATGWRTPRRGRRIGSRRSRTPSRACRRGRSWRGRSG